MFLQRLYTICTNTNKKRNFCSKNYKLNLSQESINEIKKLISDHVGIENLDKKRRNKDYIIARSIFTKLCHENGLKPFLIAKILDFNHATILHHLKEFDNDFINPNYRSSEMKSFRILYLELRPKINRKFIQIIYNN